MKTKREELRKLTDFNQFEDEDLKVLEDISWERAAYQVWYDAVKGNDMRHSQKWTGMFSARALHSALRSDIGSLLGRFLEALL